MNKDIFKDAFFGKPYKTRDGQNAIYHKTEKNKDEIWHYLIFEPIEVKGVFGRIFTYAPYKTYVNKNGKGYPENLKCYDLEDPNCPNYGLVII